MSLEFWQRVKDCFDALFDLAPPERQERIERLRVEEPDVCAEVERLFASLATSGDFLEKPLLFDPTEFVNAEYAGWVIGAYRLLHEIGRGGMSVVYLAEPIGSETGQRVAVKLVWPGFDTAEIKRRFKQEHHILAHLTHPNIARLYDGGATPEGHPYLIMEYVEGQPITQHCQVRNLPLSARLALFRTTCDAVEYAHRNQVIHRDLKPSNIFVSEAGEVKLLDFGIAKLITPTPAASSARLTQTGRPLLTPEYASPEQLMEADVVAASDVYSLGIVLYELLTGETPYRLKRRSLVEMIRVVIEQEPPRLSRRARELGLPVDPRLCHGLDHILLKALRKEPQHRYPSARELGEEIDRLLEARPIHASRDTRIYRAARFLKRTWWIWLLSLLLVSFAGLVAGARL
jgi:serine/threonine-protein kinase